MGKDERKRELPRFDGRLRDAVTDDMAAYVGEIMSSVAFRGARKGVHSVRMVQELSSFGWTEVLYPYRRGTDNRLDFRRAFGIERKMTPCASETVSRLAVQLGSFKEARDALALLGCGRMSVSKVRDETLVTGGRILEEQRKPPKDVRRYTEAQTQTPEGGRAVRRTLVVMADGTNAPCVKKDTKGVRGKNGDEAHSRQLRVMNFFEYCNVDGKGTPVPIRGSFSYAVTDGEIAEATGLLKVQGVARGSGTVPRMQCVADGEEALEKALRDAFPFAEFTNDIMHACGYLSACCQALGIASRRRSTRRAGGSCSATGRALPSTGSGGSTRKSSRRRRRREPRSTTSTSAGKTCAMDGCAGTDTASPLRTSRRPQGSSSHAGASRPECTGATTTPHASAPSSPDCAPLHEDRRDGRLLLQRNKIAPASLSLTTERFT